MAQKRGVLIIVYLLWVMLLGSCGSGNPGSAAGIASDGRYDHGVPAGDISAAFTDISKSIKLINCVGQYRSRHYSDQNGSAELDSVLAHRLARAVTLDNESSSGTATIIHYDGEQMAVLTCAHVVDYPDTIVTYYRESGHIEQIRVRETFKMYITDYGGGNYFNILAMDREQDIAVLGGKYRSQDPQKVQVMRVEKGNSRDLDWGMRCWMMGYPKGNLMVTEGIVSLRPENYRENFLVDAPFNRGFSGGPVFAFRDGVKGMEWLGMCFSVSADYNTFLVPEELGGGSSYVRDVPYRGPVFAEEIASINYGITNVMTIEKIGRFLEEQGDVLNFRF